MARPVFDDFVRQIAALLNAEPTLITRETTANDVDGWDSVRQANIIMTLEECYGIMFADDEIVELENVGMLFDRLVEHTSAGSPP